MIAATQLNRFTLKALANGCRATRELLQSLGSVVETGVPGLQQPCAGTSQRFQRTSLLLVTFAQHLDSSNSLGLLRRTLSNQDTTIAHTCSVANDSSLRSSNRAVASLREVWRAAGKARTRTLAIRSRRRIVISSPGFTVWADLAGLALIRTSPASHNFCATVRRWQRRLALRKTSRRISLREGEGFQSFHLINHFPFLIVTVSP